MMDAVIRAAREPDLAQLRALFTEANAFHAELVPEHVRTTDDLLTAEELHAFITAEDMRLLVADVGVELVGAALVRIERRAAYRWQTAREVAYMDELIVRHDARRRGVGRQLMAAAQTWAASQGADTVELHVWEANAQALRFYERLGFRTVQRRMVWSSGEDTDAKVGCHG